MKKTLEKTVEQLLEETPKPGRRSLIADMPGLAQAIEHFLRLKAAGDPRAQVTLSWFYRTKLRDHFSGPRCESVARKFARDHLRLDPDTGKPL